MGEGSRTCPGCQEREDPEYPDSTDPEHTFVKNECVYAQPDVLWITWDGWDVVNQQNYLVNGDHLDYSRPVLARHIKKKKRRPSKKVKKRRPSKKVKKRRSSKKVKKRRSSKKVKKTKMKSRKKKKTNGTRVKGRIKRTFKK